MAGPQRCAGTHQSEDLLRAYPRGFGAALTKNARGKVCTGFVYPFIPRKGAEADVFLYVRFFVSHLHLGQRRTYCMRPSFILPAYGRRRGGGGRRAARSSCQGAGL